MTEFELSHNLFSILGFIDEVGGIHCTGSCARKSPGEVHCHAISQELEISSSGARERIQRLQTMGLIECHRETTKTGSVRSIFTVTSEGQQVLNSK
jgi:predicted ArsR family transcriptional regulator